MKQTQLKRTPFKSHKSNRTKATEIKPKDQHCFLCGANGQHEHLDRHHIFNGVGLRAKSEKYGLVVYLCHITCHIYGEEAVHNNQAIDNIVKQHGQLKVMDEQGWDTERFIKEFGKNYL